MRCLRHPLSALARRHRRQAALLLSDQGAGQHAQVDLYTLPSHSVAAAAWISGPLATAAARWTSSTRRCAAARRHALGRIITNDELPRSVRFSQTPESLRAIRALQERRMRRRPYDLLRLRRDRRLALHVWQICRAAMPASPRIINRQKIDYLHYAEMAETRPGHGEGSGLAWRRGGSPFEYAEMPRFDAVVCSPEDRMEGRSGMRRRHRRAPIEVIVNGADTDFFQPGTRPPDTHPTMLLLGTMHYYPNIDAVHYYLPRPCTLPSARRHPGSACLIVGHNPPPEIERLGRAARRHRDRQRARHSPLHGRSWIRLSRCAWAAARASRSSSPWQPGCPWSPPAWAHEGLDDSPRPAHLPAADDPLAFARHCIDLLQNPTQGEAVAERAYAHIRAGYSWQQLGQKFADFCAQIAKISEGTHTDG